MASWQILKKLTVLLEDCRFMLGQRFNIKVEKEEDMISVFANAGMNRTDCIKDSLQVVMTSHWT